MTTSEANNGTPTPEATTSSQPVVPDKFKNQDGSVNTDALLQSYTELEKKLGNNNPAPAKTATEKTGEKTAEKTPVKTEETVESPSSPISAFEQEYLTTGKLSDDTYGKLSTSFGLDRSDVDSFITFRQKQAEDYASSVVGVVGGVDKYQQLQNWASQNLSESDKAKFDQTLRSGDVDAAKIAVGALQAKYERSEGRDPQLHSGRTGTATLEPFQSLREAANYKRDPRFNSDPEYRAAYTKRLAISKI